MKEINIEVNVTAPCVTLDLSARACGRVIKTRPRECSLSGLFLKTRQEASVNKSNVTRLAMD